MNDRHHSLANSAVLATLNINQWSGRKFDRSATDELNRSKHAAADAARVNKLIVSGSLIGPLRKHLNQVRQQFYADTLPWTDKGARVLPADKLMGMYQTIADARTEMQRLLHEFLRDYAHEVQKSSARLGDLFDPSDYPSTGEIQAKFSIDFSVMPVPTEDDFRVAFTEGQAEQIKQQVRDDLDKLTGRAMQHIWTSAGNLLREVRDRLRSSDGRFTSIFDNLAAHIEGLADLNVTNDPQIDALADSTRKLLLPLRDKAALRGDDAARESTAQEIDAVLDRFDGMWG